MAIMKGPRKTEPSGIVRLFNSDRCYFLSRPARWCDSLRVLLARHLLRLLRCCLLCRVLRRYCLHMFGFSRQRGTLAFCELNGCLPCSVPLPQGESYFPHIASHLCSQSFCPSLSGLTIRSRDMKRSVWPPTRFSSR